MFFNKKSSLLMLSIMLVLSLMLAACGGNQASQQEGEGNQEGTEGNGDAGFAEAEWRFITEEYQGDMQYLYAEEFAKRISEKTDGKIKVTPYEYGGLGGGVEQFEQLQNGAVQMAIISPGFVGSTVPESQVFALQFLFPTDQRLTQDILNSSEALNKDLTAIFEKIDVKPLAYWTEGAMAWTSSGVALQSPDDFNNFKMRIQMSPLLKKSYEAYGANPAAMDWGELYTALERGTVDGQENPLFFIESAKFNEVQDYITLSSHNNYVAMTTVNSTWYNGLPEKERALIDETVDEMRDWAFNKQKELNEAAVENMKSDSEIIKLTDEQIAAFKEKALPVREFYKNEVSTVGGEILDKLQKEIEAATAE